jgi:hypothetical protein
LWNTLQSSCAEPRTISKIANEQIAPGTYHTSINIHNPAESQFGINDGGAVTFYKKAVISLEEGVTQIPPSALVQDTLKDDYAEQVDCKVIRALLGAAAPAAPAFIEGYVIIIVPPTSTATEVLDVYGVYTNAKGAEVIRPATERFFTPGGAIATKKDDKANRRGGD